MIGAKLVMPGGKMDGASIYELLDTEKVTFSAAVPTVWLMLLQYLEETGKKLPYLKKVVIGGSACPRAMTEKFQKNYDVDVIHAWGMTEMSPLGTLGTMKPEYDRACKATTASNVKEKQGYAPFGVEMKVTDDENRELPWNGKTFGRLKVRGPAVARAYYGGAGADQFDEEGWFDTGDVAHIDPHGYMQITDRAKDVIKSGGEWISSIDLENLAVGHPDVAEAAVIGVPHPRWDERPLADRRAQARPRGIARRSARLHERQGRQMVDARRRRLRRRNPAHRDRQDPEVDAAQAVQGLSAAGRLRAEPLHLVGVPLTVSGFAVATSPHLMGRGTAAAILAPLSQDLGSSPPRMWGRGGSEARR